MNLLTEAGITSFDMMLSSRSSALHVKGPKFNPRHLYVGLGKTPAWIPGEQLSVSVDNTELHGPMFWLHLRQFPVFHSTWTTIWAYGSKPKKVGSLLKRRKGEGFIYYVQIIISLARRGVLRLFLSPLMGTRVLEYLLPEMSQSWTTDWSQSNASSSIWT